MVAEVSPSVLDGSVKDFNRCCRLGVLLRRTVTADSGTKRSYGRVFSDWSFILKTSWPLNPAAGCQAVKQEAGVAVCGHLSVTSVQQFHWLQELHWQ